MNRDRIRCFKCREYNHFANECLNLIPKDSDRESLQGKIQSELCLTKEQAKQIYDID